MGIKPTFTRKDVKTALVSQIKRLDTAVIYRMTYVGETFVKNARANGSYKDQTGNLRGSVGYVIFKDGVKRSTGPIPKNSRKLIEDLRSKYMAGYVLIVFAGMDYAAAVESMGKDVLTGSSIIAKKELSIAFANFKRTR